jgi:hypothetical protein
VQCSSGYAYQSSTGGHCSTPANYEQNLNGSVAVGWSFVPFTGNGKAGNGITNPNTIFNPPSFSGLPFSRAAFLQEAGSGVWQTISGFVPGVQYTLSFYLGSRYGDGNQTVKAIIDGRVIGTWNLVSYTPFTLQTVTFSVGTGGMHTLAFVGTTSGDHTAFFSGMSIQTAGGLTVTPSSAFPGLPIVVSTSGFVPYETVYLVGYASATPAVIGAGAANASGNATIAARIPQTPFGRYGLQAYGATSKKVVDGTVGIVQQIVVSPKAVPLGGTVKVQGYGFAPDETVYIAWLSPSTLLGSATSNVIGTSPAVTFVIPSGTAVGANTVIVIGQRSGAIASPQINV